MPTARKGLQLCLFLAAVAVAMVLGAASAQAASVAYLDGKEVWVSTTDGANRMRLSSGEGDWTAVAQSDLGYIVGVQLEAGKIANLSRFTVWDPSGKRIHFGPLAGNSAGSNAYPLSLDLTPDGGLIVYGFSQLIYGFPTSTLTQGHYLLPSATRSAPVPEPYKNTAVRWPTLVGERIVGTPDMVVNSVQEAGSTGSTTFAPWADFSGTGGEVHRTDVAATGTVFAAEIYIAGPPEVNKIAVIHTSGLGVLPLLGGDCFLDADGLAKEPSVSQDATTIAWQDGGGVKVGGVPTFTGAEPCVLTKAAVTISPTGSFPSIGAFDVPAFTRASKPQITAPKSQSLARLLKSGMVVRIASLPGGKATVKLSVKPRVVGRRGSKPIVIASGKGDVAAGGAAAKIKLKMNRKGRSLKRRLKGKRATLTATIGGESTTKSIKLK